MPAQNATGQMLNAPFGINGLTDIYRKLDAQMYSK